MSYIETIATNDAEDEVRAMYERQQGAWGYVPNYAKSFSHRPAVMERWGRLLAELRRPMDDRRFELVTFAAAHELANTSCSLAHGNALKPYLGNDEIAAIARMESAPGVSAAEMEMMRYARKVARDAATVEAADVERLQAHGFSDAEIFDIAGAAAGRAFFTKLLDAVGSMPDSAFGSIDSELRAVLTVGKPLDDADVEVMK